MQIGLKRAALKEKQGDSARTSSRMSAESGGKNGAQSCTAATTISNQKKSFGVDVTVGTTPKEKHGIGMLGTDYCPAQSLSLPRRPAQQETRQNAARYPVGFGCRICLPIRRVSATKLMNWGLTGVSVGVKSEEAFCSWVVGEGPPGRAGGRVKMRAMEEVVWGTAMIILRYVTRRVCR